MKSMKITALLLGIAGLTYAQDITVQGESMVNTDFSKYKTYTWAKPDLTAQSEGFEIYTVREDVVVPDSKPGKGKMNKTDRGTAGKANHSKKDSKNTPVTVYSYSYDVIIPSSNALINSSITSSIEQELEGRGYRKDEVSADLLITYKVLEQKAHFKGYNNDNPEVVGGKEVRQPQDTATYELKPGTLMINLIDTKTSKVVWNGFASGVGDKSFITTDEMKAKEAVNLIFAKYKYRADGNQTGE